MADILVVVATPHIFFAGRAHLAFSVFTARTLGMWLNSGHRNCRDFAVRVLRKVFTL